jgi:hypothetical protein
VGIPAGRKRELRNSGIQELQDGAKNPGPKDQALGWPERGASMVFSILRQAAGVMEHCKISTSKH